MTIHSNVAPNDLPASRVHVTKYSRDSSISDAGFPIDYKMLRNALHGICKA